MPTFFLCYLGQPPPDGLWRTEDHQVRQDDDGYVHFEGRTGPTTNSPASTNAWTRAADVPSGQVEPGTPYGLAVTWAVSVWP